MANVLQRTLQTTGLKAITAHDTNSIDARYNDGLLVEVSGTVKVTFIDGTVYTFAAAALPNFTQIEAKIKIVWSTGTSAAGIYGVGTGRITG